MPGGDDGDAPGLDLEQVRLVDVPPDGRRRVPERDAPCPRPRPPRRGTPAAAGGSPTSSGGRARRGPSGSGSVQTTGTTSMSARGERTATPSGRPASASGAASEVTNPSRRRSTSTHPPGSLERPRAPRTLPHPLPVPSGAEGSATPPPRTTPSPSTHRSSQRTRSAVKACALALSTSTVPTTRAGPVDREDGLRPGSLQRPEMPRVVADVLDDDRSAARDRRAGQPLRPLEKRGCAGGPRARPARAPPPRSGPTS